MAGLDRQSPVAHGSTAPLVVAAPDKFRGTASAREVADAIERAATSLGWATIAVPLSDGGEGLLDAFELPGCLLMTTPVTGPDGRTATASWRMHHAQAVVETAQASGLTMAGGRSGNDPMRATTRGTGELIAAAAAAVGSGGTVVVGLGGSAATDGGLGALTAVEEAGGLGGATLIGAYDVHIGFIEAAGLFAPQKGASPLQVMALEQRLRTLASFYRSNYGIDVRTVAGAGAAGGLGGAIVALGGRLRSGYDLVAELLDLRRSIRKAQLVITGEGALDGTSFAGKVVGGVAADAQALGVPALAVVGRVTGNAADMASERNLRVSSLSREFGQSRSMTDTLACIESAVQMSLSAF